MGLLYNKHIEKKGTHSISVFPTTVQKIKYKLEYKMHVLQGSFRMTSVFMIVFMNLIQLFYFILLGFNSLGLLPVTILKS